MSKRPTLRTLRAKIEKTRVVAGLDPKSYQALMVLMEQEPGNTISQIVGDALRFAKEIDMYGPRRDFVARMQVAQNRVPTVEASHRPIVVDKKIWCTSYGGTCDGINCTYNRFEVTASGVVVRNQITMPVRSMPENEDDFRKSVLGGFATLHEAEVAFDSQVEESFFDPSEIPTPRRSTGI